MADDRTEFMQINEEELSSDQLVFLSLPGAESSRQDSSTPARGLLRGALPTPEEPQHPGSAANIALLRTAVVLFSILRDFPIFSWLEACSH